VSPPAACARRLCACAAAHRAEHPQAGEGWVCDPQAHHHPQPRARARHGDGQEQGPPLRLRCAQLLLCCRLVACCCACCVVVAGAQRREAAGVWVRVRGRARRGREKLWRGAWQLPQQQQQQLERRSSSSSSSSSSTSAAAASVSAVVAHCIARAPLQQLQPVGRRVAPDQALSAAKRCCCCCQGRAMQLQLQSPGCAGSWARARARTTPPHSALCAIVSSPCTVHMHTPHPP
jgi:hypothetical protein